MLLLFLKFYFLEMSNVIFFLGGGEGFQEGEEIVYSSEDQIPYIRNDLVS